MSIKKKKGGKRKREKFIMMLLDRAHRFVGRIKEGCLCFQV